MPWRILSRVFWICGSRVKSFTQNLVYSLWSYLAVVQMPQMAITFLIITIHQTKIVYNSTPASMIPTDSWPLLFSLESFLILLSVTTCYFSHHAASVFTAISLFHCDEEVLIILCRDFATMNFFTQHTPKCADWVMWCSLWVKYEENWGSKSSLYVNSDWLVESC